MNVPPLYLRGELGVAISAVQNDYNLVTLRDFCNALSALFEISLNPNGTLKDGAINDVDQIVDRIITNDKLGWWFNFYQVASGTNTYTIDFTSAYTGFAWTAGLVFFVKFTNGNTTASTLDVKLNSVATGTPKAIVKNGSEALSSGDIIAGQVLVLVYDGTNFQIVGGTSPNSGTIWQSAEFDVPAVGTNVLVAHTGYAVVPVSWQLIARANVDFSATSGYALNDVIDSGMFLTDRSGDDGPCPTFVVTADATNFTIKTAVSDLAYGGGAYTVRMKTGTSGFELSNFVGWKLKIVATFA